MHELDSGTVRSVLLPDPRKKTAFASSDPVFEPGEAGFKRLVRFYHHDI